MLADGWAGSAGLSVETESGTEGWSEMLSFLKRISGVTSSPAQRRHDLPARTKTDVGQRKPDTPQQARGRQSFSHTLSTTLQQESPIEASVVS